LRFAFSTKFSYWLHADRSIDLSTLAEESYTNTVALRVQNLTQETPCKFIEVVYNMFGYDACHPDVNTLGGKAGSLRSMCAKTCGYCTSGEPGTAYRYRDWDTMYTWMDSIANIDLIKPISFNESCNLYASSPLVQMVSPSFYTVYFKFCHSDVGLSDGFAGWFVAMKEVFPMMDVVEQMSSLEMVVLPSSTTSTTSSWHSTITLTTTTKTTITTSTSSFNYMSWQQLQALASYMGPPTR
jgi:hypothetical protein